MELEILHEDKDIIVVKKPFGVASQKDKLGTDDMTYHLSNYLGENAYIGVVHRLDRPVSGVMVYAKNKEANSNLSEQIKNKQFEKKYIAVVCGVLEKDSGELSDYVIKNERLNISKVVHKNTPNAKCAILQYEVINHKENLTFVKINLVTGRHHQIRVQFSNFGFPIWGDNKYNSDFVRGKGNTPIALCANELTFKHPRTNKRMEFTITPPYEYPFVTV